MTQCMCCNCRRQRLAAVGQALERVGQAFERLGIVTSKASFHVQAFSRICWKLKRARKAKWQRRFNARLR
jgi:hypothetical protein